MWWCTFVNAAAQSSVDLIAMPGSAPYGTLIEQASRATDMIADGVNPVLGVGCDPSGSDSGRPALACAACSRSCALWKGSCSSSSPAKHFYCDRPVDTQLVVNIHADAIDFNFIIEWTRTANYVYGDT